MKQVTSPDISVVDFTVLMDISTNTPSITITNTSTQINPANLQWVFVIKSPSGVPIHEGNFTSPDRVNWTTPFVKNSGFPKPYNSIQWGTYTILVKVKDSNGTIFEHEEVPIKLCRPNGNTPNSKNTYGKASVFVTTKCKEARLFAEDRSNYTYNGLSGTIISKNFSLTYPMVDDGSQPAPFSISQFSAASIPITQSGSGYQYYLVSILDYQVHPQAAVRVKYLFSDKLSVYCNLDLSPIFCELQKLNSSIEIGTCKDAAKARETSVLVSSKLLMVLTAMLFPQSQEIDPFVIIEEINKLTGWGCDCCTSGIVPLSTIGSANGTSYEIVSDCGDIQGDVEEIAGGIRIHLRDVTYGFEISNDTALSAFTVIPSINGCQKTYLLKVDGTVLASEILNTIKNNVNLLNLFNSLVSTQAGAYNVNVDGKCVLPNNTVCDYIFTSLSLGASEKFLIRNVELQSSQIILLNFYFDGTNAGALQAALNALGIGTFSTSFTSNKLIISSAGNPNAIKAINYDYYDSSGSVISSGIQFTSTKDCTLSASTDLNAILQGIINYLCEITLAKIKAGRGYAINFLQAIQGQINQEVVTSSQDASVLLDRFITSYNGLVEIVQAIKPVNCDNIKGLFASSTTVTDTALIFGTDNNACNGYSPKTLALKILKLGQTDGDVKDELCKAVSDCASPVCPPVTNATATLVGGTLTVNITNTGAIKYRIGYYRIANGRPALSGIKETTAVSGLTTTDSWTGIGAGQYGVVIVAICANGKESAEYIALTSACGKPTSFNVTDTGTDFEISWGGLPVGAAKVRIEIVYPNGGSNITDYNISPSTISVSKPNGVYGSFTFTARTVCDVSANFTSEATDAVMLKVGAPAACPPVTGLEVTALGTTTATIQAIKPVSGSSPTAYTLRVIPQGGGGAIINTINPGGSTLTWNLTGLVANTVYSFEVFTDCAEGSGNPVNGGTFTTHPSVSNNSSITNNSGNSATNVALMVNGSLVHYVAPLANLAVSNFALPNYTTVQVKLKACDAGATAATLTSNAQVYNGVQDSTDPELFIFTGVNIVSGAVIEFS